jgi:hypothetical protein
MGVIEINNRRPARFEGYSRQPIQPPPTRYLQANTVKGIAG